MDGDESGRTDSQAVAPELEHDRLVKALTAERFRPVPRRRHHVVTAAGEPRPAAEQRRAG